MAEASGMYDNGRNCFARGDWKWLTSGGSTWKVSLIDSTYNLDATALSSNTVYSDVSAKIVGTTGTLVTADPTAGVCSATNQTFSTVTGNAVTHVVIYAQGTFNGFTNALCCGIFFASVTPNGGDITIQWDTGANKIFKL